MSRYRRTLPWITMSVAFLVCCAVAAASGAIAYRAGKPSKLPYMVATVANRHVVKIRWGFKEPCEGAMPLPASATNKLQAKIGKDGRFAKTVSYTSNGSEITTSFSGTIIARTATVKIKDQEFIPHYGGCFGTHTFKAVKT
jgi:hypothetical protein